MTGSLECLSNFKEITNSQPVSIANGDRARKTIGEGHTSHGLYLVDLHNKDLTARQNVNDGLQISNIEDHDRNSRFWIATNRNHFSA
ncbi:uncharacterized protein LOC110008149 isoform X3 [Amborella trichopoda]|uniref:uncharacterized protein LOC110008149 isoform X3 n=1 Tax=Amborella trichopoda TaxID=13333 RepID=UPI0009BEF23B|nr:uncharacterized protein LOC110008149 isoform X3 [Amborella trichopoda]|eukprot:XP_020529481.1 uncharacterized protein LOC110008149 isoform X3 [Amborella trichopoda]